MNTQARFFPTDRSPSRLELAFVQLPFFAIAASGAVAARLGPRAFGSWAAALRQLELRMPMPALKAGTAVELVALPQCAAEVVRASGVAAGGRALLYLHGGGFLGGGARTYRPFVTRLSAVAGATVLNVDYRLLPRTKIADAIDDGLDGYRWLLERGYDASQIIVAGDSAGGHLAFSVPLRIITAGLPAPAGIVAISPWLDFDSRTKLAHPNARLDPMLHIGAMDFVVRRLIAEEGVLDPLLSPVNGELAELPSSLIQVGSSEVLLVDAELMAARLVAASVPCELQIWEHQLHCFQVLDTRNSRAREAVAEIATFIEERLGP